MNEAEACAALVAAGIRLGARGLIVAAEGNLSLRIGGGAILITPAGRRKDELGADDIVRTWLDGSGHDPAEGASNAPSSDIAIHREIYRARPDVNAIVHAHLPAALGLT